MRYWDEYNLPSRERLAAMKATYRKGVRVMLDQMEDIQAPEVGTLGTVVGVDDIGSILVRWDNGSNLSVIYGEDRCHIVDAAAE